MRDYAAAVSDARNAALRQIISDIVAALGTSAGCSPDASLEFMRGIPAEVAATAAALSQRIAELEAWQPIETAPKDGSTEVDLWFPTAGRRTSWRWYRKGYWGSIPRHRFQRVDTCDEQPTHWQPPPAPPAVQAADGKRAAPRRVGAADDCAPDSKGCCGCTVTARCPCPHEAAGQGGA